MRGAGLLLALLTCVLAAPGYGASLPGKMIPIPGGTFMMGSDGGPPEERPRHRVRVAPFLLARTPVTVAQFAGFVTATGYQTTAERYGNSAVMSMTDGQWRLVDGADWRHPLGPDGPEALPTHPVVHVSWYDARSYCEHFRGRLPTEAEWEHAARNGRGDTARYAFGDKLVRDGDFLANVWTGHFPDENTAADGYLYTSPVGVFGSTELGLTDMAGNVWEWTSTWFAPYDPDSRFHPTPTSEKVQRGGSFLCDEDVCHGFRTTARGHSTPDSSHMHVGFRCAANATSAPRAHIRAAEEAH